MTLDVDTPTLRSVAADFDTAAGGASSAGTELTGVGDPSHGHVKAGLDAMTVAWGAALAVLGEDLSLLSAQVSSAAEVYDQTDGNLAGAVAGGGG